MKQLQVKAAHANYFCSLCLCLFTMSATTIGSAKVEMSPKSSGRLEAIWRRIRRIIFPERVFGRPDVTYGEWEGQYIHVSSMKIINICQSSPVLRPNFCMHPAALLKNRVWTPSLGKLGAHDQPHRHVVTLIRLLRESNYVYMSLQIATAPADTLANY